ncbi:hypothetical protein KIPB_000295 [Kipferlia bialata]|uniref:Tyrosine-protein kinase ephrin type A/B receptor-like domain-containing protein n=1 Tax=Kipferlia bialata TaxID=797122 RepID=A0A9K3CNT8_9EUKA|nr:hypothetical protein KIPB_000295 [Kipferlia bialata]|eukprot:g295.t1
MKTSQSETGTGGRQSLGVRVETPPPKREGHVIEFIPDTDDPMCLIYGGMGLTDLWEMHVTQDGASSPTFSSATTLGAQPDITGYSCGWTHDGLFYVFAGLTDNGASSKMYAYDPPNSIWAEISREGGSDWPGPRYRQVCEVYTDVKVDPSDPTNEALWEELPYALVYGGRGPTGFIDELWRYDVVNNSWEQLSPGGEAPCAREAASMGVLVVPSPTSAIPLHVWLIIYSGRIGNYASTPDPQDTWVVDIGLNTPNPQWVEITGTANANFPTFDPESVEDQYPGPRYLCQVYLDCDLYCAETEEEGVYEHRNKYLMRDGLIVMYGWFRIAQRDRGDGVILSFNGEYTDPTLWRWNVLENTPDKYSVANDGVDNCMVPPVHEWTVETADTVSSLSPDMFYFGGYMELEGASNCMSSSVNVQGEGGEVTTEYEILLSNQISPPESSLLASAVVGENMYIFGGYRGDTPSQASMLWTLDMGVEAAGIDNADEDEETWSMVPTPSFSLPVPRERHSMHSWGGNLLVMLGKDTELDALLNDIWVFWLSTNTWEQLYPNEYTTGDVYPPTSSACTLLADNSIYAYGGRTASSLSSAMWRFDLRSKTWVELTLNPLTRPTDSDTGLPFTDAEYDAYVSDNTPPAMETCHLDNINGKMFLYGGVLASNAPNYGWYEVSVDMWGEAETGAGGSDRDEGDVPELGPDEVTFRRYQYLAGPDNEADSPPKLVHNGVDNAAIPVQWPFPELESDSESTDTDLSTSDTNPTNPGWHVLCLGGRMWSAVFNYRYVHTLDPAQHSIESAVLSLDGTGDMLPGLAGMAYQYHGDRIYLYGGWRTSMTQYIEGSGNSDLYTAMLTPVSARDTEGEVLYDSCSAGTFYTQMEGGDASFVGESEGGTCTPCPMGTYKSVSDTTCVTCADGYYSQTLGARSYLQCTPCPEGTHAFYVTNEDGSLSIDHSQCQPCEDDEYCPIGSISAATEPEIVDDTESQPPARPLMSGYVQTLTRVCYIVAGVLCVCLAAMLLCTYPVRNSIRVERFDRFTLDHPTDDHAPVINRQTRIGGYFSLVYYLFGGAMAVSLLIGFYKDNIQESKSTIPNFLVSTLSLGVAEESATQIAFVGAVDLEFSFFGSMTDCVSDRADPDQFGACASSLSVTADGIETLPDTGRMTHECAWQRTEVTGNVVATGYSCHVQYRFTDCVFTTSDTDPFLNVHFGGLNAHAQSVSASVAFGSSVPDEDSSISVELVPSAGHVFKGISPCRVTVGATPSLFQDATGSNGGTLTTGFHLELDAKQTGDEADTVRFPYVNGVGAEIEFIVRDSTLVTTLSMRTTMGAFAGVALGSVVGLSGTFSTAMGYVEDFFQGRKRKIKKTLDKASRKAVAQVPNPLSVHPVQQTAV